MSSVNSNSGTSGSSSSGVDERVRKAREDYRKKEAELIKKHNQEIKALNDRYVKSMDEKDAAQSNHLKAAREKSQESLTNKDMKYQKEMEELRAMHNKQIEKLLQDNKARLEAQTDAARLEVKQARLGKNDRVDELHNRYDQQRLEQEEKFTDALDHLRKEQSEAINRNREKYNEKIEGDLENLRDDRDETVAQLRNDYRRLQKNTDQRLRSQEVRHTQDKFRTSSNYMDTLKHQEEVHNRQQELSREGYEQGLNEVRNDMAHAREKDLQAQQDVTEQYNSDVKDRVDTQVNRLEREIRKTREKSIADQVDTDNKAKRQISNMRDAYQNKFDYLEKARIETLRQSNDINAQNIKKVVGQADKQMAENTRYYISRNEIDNLKNRQHIDSIEKEHKLVEEYNRVNADSRIQRIQENANEAYNTINETYKTNLDTLKEGNNEEKKDLILKHVKEKNQTESQFKDFMQRQEVTHQRKTDDIVNKYEKRLAEMNDQFVREKRLRDNREKALVNEINRRHEAEIEAMKIKYEDQNKQTSLNHERDLRETQRRSQQKIDEVINAMKKS